MLGWFIILFVRLYWLLVPARFRRTCLFRESCSHHVLRRTVEGGGLAGLDAFWRRWRRCRPGAVLVETALGYTLRLADGSLADPGELSPGMLPLPEGALAPDRLLSGPDQRAAA